MVFPWAGKRDPDKDDSSGGGSDEPADCGRQQPGQLQQVLAHLGEIEKLLGHATQQIAASLISSATPAAQAPADQSLAAALRPVQEKLDQIEARLNSLGPAAAAGEPDDAVATAIAQLRDRITEQSESLGAALRQLRQQLDDGLAKIAECIRPAQPAEPSEPAATPATSADWQRALLGRQLAEDPALGFQRQQLFHGVLEGHPAACALVGQMLVFHSAPAEKMPALLKEIGEAYYRWQPKTKPGSNKMEDALVSWLKKTCDEAGIANTIELVHPGERFDSARHSASGRGVEITEVHGWIVLRDNGKVYTKASVAVK
jgi:hypothetical protein